LIEVSINPRVLEKPFNFPGFPRNKYKELQEKEAEANFFGFL
jgi:hypothetical protein